MNIVYNFYVLGVLVIKYDIATCMLLLSNDVYIIFILVINGLSRVHVLLMNLLGFVTHSH